MQTVDPRALVSLITGLVAFMFMFRPDSWIYFWSLPLGITAVWSGVGVLRQGKSGMGISVAGVVLGTIAACVWILARV